MLDHGNNFDDAINKHCRFPNEPALPDRVPGFSPRAESGLN
jgi:hypothetical protein